MTGRTAAWIGGALLVAVYAATLAPDVTFWDAGEFIAAAHSLGIPHPPGTPLYIFLLNVWARFVPLAKFAVATNLFSALCTVAAVVLATRLVGWRRGLIGPELDGWCMLAAMICAGSMTSVWLNATETEVYAVSLALVAVTLTCADRAGRTESARWRALVAYLVVLAVPLHLSALVGAPAAIYLAAAGPEGRVSRRTVLALTGVLVIAVGIGRVSATIAATGVLLVASSILVERRVHVLAGVPSVLGLVVLAALGASALAMMLVRAPHDPFVNQGAPTTFAALTDVVARRQYDVPGLWPRSAPLWLQIANWFEYADWQFALSLGPTVVPTVGRTAVTVAFGMLGVAGSMAHRRRDMRQWRALLLLFTCGSIGVLLYLNLRAGPSFGWGILPDGSPHEARERDYFFVLGFLVWGLWAGLGAVTLARRRGWPPVAGAAIAALPLVLNWAAVSRRDEPAASLPRQVAESILGSAPPGAVLFVDGDNDSYPLWFAQEVWGMRRDVTTVTLPLLGTAWYERELSRRFGLVPRGKDGEPRIGVTETALAERARALGRPVAAAITVPARTRNQIADGWMVRGLVYVSDTVVARRRTNHIDAGKSVIAVAIDSGVTRTWKDRIERWRAGRSASPSIDPIDEWALGVLACPRLMLSSDPAQARLDSLASTCNLR